MPLDLTALEQEVNGNASVDQSAIALINGLATQVEATKGDPAKVQELANNLRASSAALAAAVAANTPAAPEEPAEEPTEPPVEEPPSGPESGRRGRR